MANLKPKMANSKLFEVFQWESVKTHQKHTTTEYQKKLALHEVDNKKHIA